MTGFPAFREQLNNLVFAKIPLSIGSSAASSTKLTTQPLSQLLVILVVGQNDGNCHFDGAGFCKFGAQNVIQSPVVRLLPKKFLLPADFQKPVPEMHKLSAMNCFC